MKYVMYSRTESAVVVSFDVLAANENASKIETSSSASSEVLNRLGSA